MQGIPQDLILPVVHGMPRLDRVVHGMLRRDPVVQGMPRRDPDVRIQIKDLLLTCTDPKS